MENWNSAFGVRRVQKRFVCFLKKTTVLFPLWKKSNMTIYGGGPTMIDIELFSMLLTQSGCKILCQVALLIKVGRIYPYDILKCRCLNLTFSCRLGYGLPKSLSSVDFFA